MYQKRVEFRPFPLLLSATKKRRQNDRVGSDEKVFSQPITWLHPGAVTSRNARLQCSFRENAADITVIHGRPDTPNNRWRNNEPASSIFQSALAHQYIEGIAFESSIVTARPVEATGLAFMHRHRAFSLFQPLSAHGKLMIYRPPPPPPLPAAELELHPLNNGQVRFIPWKAPIRSPKRRDSKPADFF
ncbi:hypothetical protein KM043_004737 [Ampulex compressa]|nr:hypothetical protein KM043_004737 [Ampulex compressa]